MRNSCFFFWHTFSLEPNEELVKVIGLKHGVQVAGPNNTFSTTVWWEKPLFTHSGVKHYTYKVIISDQKRRKRDINLYAGVDTVSWKEWWVFLRITAEVFKLVSWEPGRYRYSTKFYMARLRPAVQQLTQFYVPFFFGKKGTPFTYLV